MAKCIKVIKNFRHGTKTPKNNITVECKKDIIQNGISGVGTDVNMIHSPDLFKKKKSEDNKKS